MKQKFEYTTFNESGLGKLLPQIEAKVTELAQRAGETVRVSPNLESLYTEKQFQTLLRFIQMAKSIVPSFDKGNQPNTAGLVLKYGSMMLEGKRLLENFATPRLVIYHHLKENLKSIAKKASQDITNPEVFSERLKQILADEVSAAVKDIPCNDVDSYSTEIEWIFTKDFSSFFKQNGSFKLEEFINKAQEDLSENFKRDSELYDLNVTHPLTYEFIGFLFNLLENTPDHLDSLLSFLHPNAIAYGITYVEDKDSRWVYTIGKSNHDFNQNFQRLKSSIAPELLSDKLVSYFEAYGRSNHVLSERAKMSLITRFLDCEIQSYQEEIMEVTGTSPDVSGMPVDLSAIDQIEDYELQLKKQLERIDARLQSYQNQTVAQLFNAHPKLAEQLESDRRNFNVDYSGKVLPESMLMEDGYKFVWSPIRNRLQTVLNEQKAALKEELKKAQVKKEQAFLQYHTSRFEDFSKQLAALDHEFSGLLQRVTELSVVGNLNDLEKALQTLEENRQSFEEAQQALSSLKDELSSIQYPNGSLARLRPNIENLHKQTTKQYETVEKIMKQAAHAFREKGTELNSRLQKEQAAAEMQKLVSGLNLDHIVSVLKEKEHLLKEQQNKLNSAAEELSQKQKEAVQIDDQYGISNPLSWDDPTLKLRHNKNLLIKEISNDLQHLRGPLLSLEVSPQTINSLYDISLDSFEGLKLAFDTLLIFSGEQDAKAHQFSNQENELYEFYRGCLEAQCDESKINRIKVSPKLKEAFGVTANSNNAKLLLILLGYDEKTSFSKNREAIVRKTTEQFDLVLKAKLYMEMKEQLTKSIANLRSLLTLIVEIDDAQVKLSSEYNLKRANALEAIKEQTSALSQLESGEKLLQEEILILKTIQTLLEGNNRVIELFNSGDIQNAEENLGELNPTFNEFKVLIENLSPGLEGYKDSYEVLAKIQMQTAHRIAELRKDVVTNKLNAILDKVGGEISNGDLGAQFEEFNTICSQIAPSFAKIDELRRQLTTSYGSVVDVESERKDLSDLLKETEAQLIKKADAVLTACVEELTQQSQRLHMDFSEQEVHIKAHQEAVETVKAYRANSSVTSITGLIDTLERLLPDTADFRTRVLDVKSAILDLDSQIIKNESILSGQLQRFQTREQIVQKYTQGFSQYIEHRNVAYRSKDFFTSSDKIAREQFVNRLLELLGDYRASGDSENLLAHLASKVQFQGFNLRSLTTRLMIEIQDLDKQTPTDANSYVSAEASASPNHESAMEELQTWADQNASLHQAVLSLTKKITELEQYGEEIKDNIAITLAGTLRERLDAYILKGSLEAQDFTVFQKDFMEHLHSQDDHMSKHRAFWKPFVFTVLAALVTAAIALGINKIATGHALFFAETNRYKMVKDMENTLSSAIAVTA
ncbi:hypothetical protein EAS68_09180 [Legionella jordanis]|uniref:hypothetical protein n=1 Tax=Legionella jordanis TaxID=456 RepID=UPI000EFE7F5E|nr:hypothetical protein [Legionella jordanis]RMX18262.1 hypothetical protein EAS68_09180 [Legionella jordanis]